MLIPPGPIRVLVATKPVDFRKGMDGLVAPVKDQLKADPFSEIHRGSLQFSRGKRNQTMTFTLISVLAGGIQGRKAPLPHRAHQFLYLATTPSRHRSGGLPDDAHGRAERRTHHSPCGITHGFGQIEDDRGSEGRRPQTRQGFWATRRTCSRSRTRRGSGRLSPFLSIAVPLSQLGLTGARTEICTCASWTGDISSLASLAANSAFHLRRVGCSRSQFFSARFWCAHSAASSPKLSYLSSARSRSRSFAEACSPSVGVAVSGLGFPGPFGLVSAGAGWVGIINPPPPFAMMGSAPVSLVELCR